MFLLRPFFGLFYSTASETTCGPDIIKRQSVLYDNGADDIQITRDVLLVGKNLAFRYIKSL